MRALRYPMVPALQQVRVAAGEGTRYSLVASLTRVPPWWEERTDPTVDL